MWWDGEFFINSIQNNIHDGIIVTYYANTPKNSYAKLNRSGGVVEVKEKEVISNISLNGIHYWKHGSDFVQSAEEMIKLKDKSINGEYYIGPTYNYMIKNNKRVGIFHIPDSMHNSVGTPDDLREYLRKL
jgi:dTDP-glucose pyrophosphorylase